MLNEDVEDQTNKQTSKNKKEAAFKSSGKKSNERKKINAPTKRLDWGQSHQSTTLWTEAIEAIN